MIGISELRRKIQLTKLESEPYAWYVMRKFSIYLTLLLVKLKFTPNMVTISAMVFGIIGCGIWMLGTDLTFIAGGIFFQMMYLFDCSDGELARYLGKSSLQGVFLDLMGHYVVNFTMILGAGVGLSSIFGSWIFYLSIIVVLIFLGDEFQRVLLLKVAHKAGIYSGDIYDHYSFRDRKASSQFFELLGFLCGPAGMFTGMLLAALLDSVLPGDWIKITFFITWSILITFKFVTRFARIYLQALNK